MILNMGLMCNIYFTTLIDLFYFSGIYKNNTTNKWYTKCVVDCADQVYNTGVGAL